MHYNKDTEKQRHEHIMKLCLHGEYTLRCGTLVSSLCCWARICEVTQPFTSVYLMLIFSL